jgi:hypothetical protein
MSEMRKLLSFIVIVIFVVMITNSNNNTLSIRAETFTSNRIIENNLSVQVQPSIVIDEFDNVYVVWRDYRNDPSLPSNSRGDIYFARSIDDGLTFNISQKVSDDPGDTQQNIPSVVMDSDGIIHVVWEDWRNDADGRYVGGDGGIDGLNNSDIYYSNSSDGGMTWSTSKMINDDGGTTDQGRPDISIDSNDVIHIVWEDRRRVDNFDIYYANSINGGITFSVNNKINDVDSTSRDPAIAVDHMNNLHIVWTDKRNTGITGRDIYYANSTDGGINFSSNKRISDDIGNTYQLWPDIAADGGIIGIVWQDERETSIYFANSTDSGITFGANKRVNDVVGAFNIDTAIAINKDGYICIAWEGKDNDIYFANSSDGGATFSPAQRVNDDVGSNFQRLASIALKNRTSYIAWQDNRNGNYDIYFSRSNWEPPMTTPFYPPNDSTLTNTTPSLEVTPVIDQDNDTVYYNFTISDQPDVESGTVYYSGWTTFTSWKPPPLPVGKWYWHTYTYDGFNLTSPNWVWNFTIDTSQSYNIQLSKGWNLISNPFIQANTDISSVLNSINGSYDAVQMYDAYDNSDPWKHHHISKPSQMNDLEDIDHKMGIWVHVTQPGGVLLQCSGIIPAENQSITLKKGWNLVGYPSLSNKTRDVALNNLTFNTEIDAIWTYNASSQLWDQISEFDYFERGRGYWIHAKTDCVWEVPL